ncbi:hypothetical protein BDV93DRAFT_260710 [Ceratobasidium sp. AG-I]|nr:hypothetical protein BDV93DRAFT_260710 [Ceratobasidium sp. AG-I]
MLTNMPGLYVLCLVGVLPEPAKPVFSGASGSHVALILDALHKHPISKSFSGFPPLLALEVWRSRNWLASDDYVVPTRGLGCCALSWPRCALFSAPSEDATVAFTAWSEERIFDRQPSTHSKEGRRDCVCQMNEDCNSKCTWDAFMLRLNRIAG